MKPANSKDIRLRRLLWGGHAMIFSAAWALFLIVIFVIAFGQSFQLFHQLYLISAIFWIFLFLFFLYGFYRGVRIIEDNFRIRWKFLSVAEGLDLTSGDDPFSFLVSFVVSLLFSFLLSLLLSYFISLFWFALIIFYGVLYFLIVRSLRRVFISSRMTRGDLARSTALSFIFASIYSSWLFLIVYTADYISKNGFNLPREFHP